MLGRQRRSGDVEADTIVIKWDVDDKYSKVKSTRVTTASWKVGDQVSVKMPPPATKELTGTVIFFGSNAQAEHEVSKLSGSDDDDYEYLEDTYSSNDRNVSASATKEKPSANGVKRQNSSVAIAQQLAKKAKEDALLTSAQTVNFLSAKPPASQRSSLLKPTKSDETEDCVATFSNQFEGESYSQTFSSQAASSSAKDCTGNSEQRCAVSYSTSAAYFPERLSTSGLFTPNNFPMQAQHDCCVNILNKLDSMEKVLWARFDAMQEKISVLTRMQNAYQNQNTEFNPVNDQTASASASAKVAETRGGSFTAAIQVPAGAMYCVNSGAADSERQLISSEDLRKDLMSSCSASNFAVKLVYRLYPEEERKNKNCCGKRGKDPLSPTRLNFIKSKTAMYFPSPIGTSEKDSWKQCKRVIDSYLRKYNFPSR